MTYSSRHYITDNAVTYGSAEYRRKLSAGWFFISFGGNGFCTMGKKKGGR